MPDRLSNLERMLSARTGSRRSLLGASAGLLVGSILAPAAWAQGGTPEASQAGGEWSFIDDKGVTVTLPRRPERIVADVSAAAPLWDFGIRPLAVYGWTAVEKSDSPVWGNIDIAAVENIVDDSGAAPDLERLLELKPDLIVTVTWDPDDPEEYWSIETVETLERIRRMAPIVAIAATGSAGVSTDRFAELAGLLGADLQSPELVEAKRVYDETTAAFSQVATSKADLTSLFIAELPEALYIASPPDWGDLSFYMSLGMNIILPDVPPGGYWEELSWEQALKYPSDVIFYSTRSGEKSKETLVESYPTLGAHPAIDAGQIGGWNQDFIMSYQGMTAALASMMEILTAAVKVTE